jgi:hypothetical protein
MKATYKVCEVSGYEVCAFSHIAKQPSCKIHIVVEVSCIVAASHHVGYVKLAPTNLEEIAKTTRYTRLTPQIKQVVSFPNVEVELSAIRVFLDFLYQEVKLVEHSFSVSVGKLAFMQKLSPNLRTKHPSHTWIDELMGNSFFELSVCPRLRRG